MGQVTTHKQFGLKVRRWDVLWCIIRWVLVLYASIHNLLF